MMGDLITEGCDSLNVGPDNKAGTIEGRKLWSMQCNAAHTVVINEYESNMWGSRFDSLAAIEAKSAIKSAYKQGWTVQSEVEEECQPKVVMTNQTLEIATSPSPVRGTQEEPRIDMSSQEEENVIHNVT